MNAMTVASFLNIAHYDLHIDTGIDILFPVNISY